MQIDFHEVAKQLDIKTPAARMRYTRLRRALEDRGLPSGMTQRSRSRPSPSTTSGSGSGLKKSAPKSRPGNGKIFNPYMNEYDVDDEESLLIGPSTKGEPALKEEPLADLRDIPVVQLMNLRKRSANTAKYEFSDDDGYDTGSDYLASDDGDRARYPEKKRAVRAWPRGLGREVDLTQGLEITDGAMVIPSDIYRGRALTRETSADAGTTANRGLATITMMRAVPPRNSTCTFHRHTPPLLEGQVAVPVVIDD